MSNYRNNVQRKGEQFVEDQLQRLALEIELNGPRRCIDAMVSSVQYALMTLTVNLAVAGYQTELARLQRKIAERDHAARRAQIRVL